MTSSSTKICRACLSEGEGFSYTLGENVSTDLYFFCIAVKINEDSLPRTLCDLCFENLKKYSEFKTTCIESENTLYRNHLGHNSVKPYCVRNGENDLEHLSPITMKAEIVSDDIVEHAVFAVKPEDMVENFGTDLYNSMDFDDNSATEFGENSAIQFVENALNTIIKKSMKKRKIRKLEKQTGVHKAKLKIARNHFSFSCDMCNKKFKYLERYEAHKLEHEGKEVVIRCIPCNKPFLTWNGLQRHNVTDHTIVSLDKLRCDTCGKICKSHTTLQMHKKIHTERIIYVCDMCGKGYISKTTLKIHLERHQENREKLFNCEQCGKKFQNATSLHSHVTRSHTDRRFICEICSYPFTSKFNLAKHLLLHDGIKLHKCEICLKSFSAQSTLVEHMRIHSGERPYACSECSKCFLSKRRRDDHMKIHTGERPHRCIECDQRFTQRGTLKRHMKVHDRTVTILS